MQDDQRHGLGYVIGQEDPRKSEYPARQVIDTLSTVQRPWKYHGVPWLGDQGQEPECVGYSGAHYLVAGPTTHKQRPPHDPRAIYRLAQQKDREAGRYYSGGTTMTAGALALRELGYIGGFYWASNLDEVTQAVKAQPVWAGTAWYSGMSNPDGKGLIKVTGRLQGGHAWLLVGVNEKTGLFKAANSWSVTWGKKGFFWITFSDFERLLNEQGEALIMTEQRLA